MLFDLFEHFAFAQILKMCIADDHAAMLLLCYPTVSPTLYISILRRSKRFVHRIYEVYVYAFTQWQYWVIVSDFSLQSNSSV